MPNADYYAPGQWNAICDRCGKKFKSSQLFRDWQGYMLCARDWEPRHPQDYVRAPPPERAPPWVRPPQEDEAPYCTQEGIQAIPGFAIPGCAIPAQDNRLWLDYTGSNCTMNSTLCRADYGKVGCATVGVH